MSTLALTPQWHDAINQVETTEKILGGATGNANLATKQLAENILWLKQTIENIRNEPIKVGDIYTTTISHTNATAVATHHGYGTWERYAEGRTLVGFSTKTSDPADYKAMGNEFGANTHQLVIDEFPSHKHSQGDLYNKFMAKATDVNSAVDSASYIGSGTGLTVNGADNSNPSTEHQVSQMSAKAWTESTEESIGGGEPHNNTQPSKVIAYWLRTA